MLYMFECKVKQSRLKSMHDKWFLLIPCVDGQMRPVWFIFDQFNASLTYVGIIQAAHKQGAGYDYARENVRIFL